MDDRVVDGDDLARVFYRARHEDPVAKRIADAVGDRGFAVAGRAIHQDRPPGGDRRPEVGNQVRRQDQVPHGLFQAIAGQLDVTHRLAFDLFGVDLHRDGHGAEVFRLRQRIQRPRPAVVGQLIAHLAGGGGRHRPRRLDQQLVATQVHQFLGHRHGQADGARQVRHGLGVAAEHGLDDDVTHHHHRQPHPFQRAGRRGRLDAALRLHVHGVSPWSVMVENNGKSPSGQAEMRARAGLQS